MAVKNYDIQKSSIWKDILQVISQPAINPMLVFQITIHTEYEDYAPIVLRHLDIVRNYESNFGDITLLTFDMAFGDYVHRFYPFTNNLEATVSVNYIEKTDNRTKKPNVISKRRYKMVFLPEENEHVNLSEYQAYDAETLNKLKILTVKVQLLDRILEPLRIKMTEGVYRKVKQETILRAVIAEQANQILVDGKPALGAIDIYPPDNTEIQQHIIIPHNTLIVSIPTFLQEKMNGVYNAGIGSYLQYYNKLYTWFVYPIYNPSRYTLDKTQHSKMVFYYMPSFQYNGIENTYRVDGNIVSVLCTSNKQYLDDGDTNYMNKGVGFMQSDARAYMKKPVVMTENGPQGNPARLTSQVANAYRDDGLNYAPATAQEISSNPFLQYSKVAQRALAYIQLDWQHSDDSLIYPGMPCEFVYLENGVRKSVTGIIAQCHTFVHKANQGIVSAGFLRKSTLLIHAARMPKITQTPSGQAVTSINTI